MLLPAVTDARRRNPASLESFVDLSGSPSGELVAWLYAVVHKQHAEGLDCDEASSASETPTVAETSHPQQNHILDALPQPDRERLFPHLKLVSAAARRGLVRGWR